jgi:F-type H+-transporting ATPase subunit delta
MAKDKGLTSELRKDAGLIAEVCATSSDFIILLESPIVKTSQKTKAIQQIFTGNINPLSLNFLVLILNNKREKNIPGIFRNLEELYRKEEGIKTAEISSALPLDDSLIIQITQKLVSEFNVKVELTQKINKSLIGGFVLRFDDLQYDASVSTQLKKIKEKLLQTELK